MNAAVRILLTLLPVIITLPARAAAVGDELPAFELKDASGKPRVLDANVRRIYTTADRSGDKLVKAALQDRTQAVLEAQGAVIVADISGAPGFVKGFIRSSVKDRPYVTWLDESGTTRSLLAFREDQVGIMELDARRVTAIRFVANVEALRRELEPPELPGAPAPAPSEPAASAPAAAPPEAPR